jgi:hypothetical protein
MILGEPFRQPLLELADALEREPDRLTDLTDEQLVDLGIDRCAQSRSGPHRAFLVDGITQAQCKRL